LKVVKSSVKDQHIGERVWMNPFALGLGKLFLGKSFTAVASRDSDSDSDSDSDDDDESSNHNPKRFNKLSDRLERMNPEKNLNAKAEEETPKKRELECKSAWLNHLSLTSDMCTEREGNEIRPIPGLDGVDFLTEIATFNVAASYVFAPVINLLTNQGYVGNLNLDAVPYDWRIPPPILEKRDGYFTKTMERIEKMYADNGNTPVVLLCHSMGCKTGHYLLNFALGMKGREWIDQYVHTYMPLGAPHIGAASPVGMAISGSVNPILDPMLSLEERLVFARSLGSALWFVPTYLPSIERNAPPTIMCKKEGMLSVEILHSVDNPLGDMRKLVTNKHGTRDMLPFKIRIEYGTRKNKDRVHCKSDVAKEINSNPSGTDPQYFEVTHSKFIFPTPSTLVDDSCLNPIRFTIMERGDIRPHELESAGFGTKVLRFLGYKDRAFALFVHGQTKKAEKHKVPVAMSGAPLQINVRDLLESGEDGITLEVPIVARVDMSFIGLVPKPNHRSVTMTIRVKWTPPPSNDDDDLTNPMAFLPSQASSEESQTLFATTPEIQSTRAYNDTDPSYVPLSGQAILRAEGLEKTMVKVVREIYGKDPMDSRVACASDRPPVKRIYAIYGINVDTEVSKMCCRAPCYYENDTPQEKYARARFRVDTQTKLGTNAGGHKLKKGALMEDASTPQINLLTGERVKCSGDGTVPYYSLQQAQVWAKEVADADTEDKVKVEEIDGAEHRAMLNDERFHKMLVEFLVGRTVV